MFGLAGEQRTVTIDNVLHDLLTLGWLVVCCFRFESNDKENGLFGRALVAIYQYERHRQWAGRGLFLMLSAAAG